MQSSAEVIIIGGGVIGCSTAYYLAKAGVKEIVIVEKEQVGSGSSSRSAAMLTLQFCQDPLTCRMAQYSYDRYMEFEEEMGAPTGFHRSGWMYVATEASAEKLARQVEMLNEAGIHSELLAPDEVKQRYPELNTEDVVSGSWGEEDGPFDPHMIMWGYLKRARQMGVSLREGVAVRDIVVEGGRVKGVVVGEERIASPIVINAAGPWASRVGQWAGVRIPLYNSTRSIVVTNPVPEIPPTRPFVEDLTAEWYFRPEVDGVLMGMGNRPVSQLDVELDEEQVELMIETAVHRVPVLERASLQTAWTGIRPLTPDGLPVFGSVPGLEGFLLNCGWGGVGIMMAPVAGQLMAELVTSGACATMEVSALGIDRFGDE